MHRTVTALAGLLILYGSLYPFEFAAARPGALLQLLTQWRLFTGLGDVLGNVALFIPFAASYTAELRPRHGLWHSAVRVLVVGGVLALLAQLGQLLVPQRDAQMGDVVWNLTGCALGIALGDAVRAAMRSPSLQRGRWEAVLLLVMCLVAEWLPLVPSLDWGLLKAHGKQVLGGTLWPLPFQAAAPHIAIALLMGHALETGPGKARSLPVYLALLLGVAAGKLLIVGTVLSPAALAGLALGGLGWLMLRQAQQAVRAQVLSAILLALYSLAALSPWTLRDSPGSMTWLPLAALLEGSMLSNSQALMTSLVIFAGILKPLADSGSSLRGMSLALAIWVFMLEQAQRFIEGRSADITEPLLVLAVGFALLAHRRSVPQAGRAASPRASSSAPAPARTSGTAAIGRWHPLVLLLSCALPIVIALHQLLHLPGIPYNVRDLFRGNGHPVALAMFTLGLLWLGAGSGRAGRCLARSRWPALVLPLAGLACGLVSLLLVWSGVTTESIEDIAGSTNLVWFVTNKNIWGDSWRHVFLALDMPLTISFVERCVRYAALYGPLPVMLGLLVAMPLRTGPAVPRLRWSAAALAGGGLFLWLCKAIAFDWSSTDNLNELIAADGPWGWGGGGYLYALLALLCVQGWLWGSYVQQRPLRWLAVLALSLLLLPAGWWLLNEGLEAQVKKYGLVYSGVQFLLGPDRSHGLDEATLRLRWFALQSATVLLLALGLWLERQLAAWPSRRPAVTTP
ncbi:VanZ family protein [Aquabacterium sp.]|uniref:VanZ family protein n=1 Tax=Aquabacterium sp. TaxID=1872578 RepID=UPI002BE015EF|nr:VanZ family protein [Aquabacterium sp.]HSW08360.1 VanZ family protein [Aquabacterium sp.]